MAEEIKTSAISLEKLVFSSVHHQPPLTERSRVVSSFSSGEICHSSVAEDAPLALEIFFLIDFSFLGLLMPVQRGQWVLHLWVSANPNLSEGGASD